MCALLRDVLNNDVLRHGGGGARSPAGHGRFEDIGRRTAGIRLRGGNAQPATAAQQRGGSLFFVDGCRVILFGELGAVGALQQRTVPAARPRITTLPGSSRITGTAVEEEEEEEEELPAAGSREWRTACDIGAR